MKAKTPLLDSRQIGFIGLGLMGRPMVVNLQRAGVQLHVYNRSQPVVDELAATGMMAHSSPRQVSAAAEILIMMLPDTSAVEAVLLGDDGILAGIKPGQLVIDMGTTAVTATRHIAKRFAAAGVDYVDAPVSGGEVGAKAGTLAIMAGGSVAAIERACPIFAVLGERFTHVGDSGAGQIAKAANQVIVGLNIGAVAEALTLAQRAGADAAKVREALRGGFADSRILELHGQRMLDAAFTPGGKCTTQRKDLDQALQLAAESALELPITALVRDLYDCLIEAGGGDLDHSALIKVIADD